VIEAETPFGALHALTSLAQLAWTPNASQVCFPDQLSIQDAPDYAYRGLGVSPGQRFMPMDLLKRTIEAMAFAKMNVLHFHLSEFCRYAIESKRHPGLQENLKTGINRGFYSFSDVRELVSYARSFGIRVVPEFDVPGHQARNMGQGIPQLSWCASRPPVAGDYQWQLRDDEEGATFGVISDLFDEISSIFPDEVIHIGGDEVTDGPLGQCSLPEITSLEEKVMALMTHRLNRTVQAWEELLTVTGAAKVDPRTILHAWRGGIGDPSRNAAHNITSLGFRCIQSAADNYYLGYNRGEDYGALWKDIGEGLSAEQRKLMLGGEVFIWTDHYCWMYQCGSDDRHPPPIAAALYARERDAQFAASTTATTFPFSLVAAGSWWHYDASMDPKSDEFRRRILDANEKLISMGVDACPTKCALSPTESAGCNETHRCGVPYVSPREL
jgi:hexosaminidase